MADDKERTRIDDSGIIICDSPEYRALIAGLREMTALAERIPALVKPALMGERSSSGKRLPAKIFASITATEKRKLHQQAAFVVRFQ